MHVITPDELREFQIEHYTDLMNNAKTFKQKIFLRKQIYNLKNLQNGIANRNRENAVTVHRGCGCNNDNRRCTSIHSIL